MLSHIVDLAGLAAMDDHVLEPAAQRIADATAQPAYLYDLGPDGARQVLDDIQAAPIDMPDIDEKVDHGAGGGWVLGNAGTHDRLVRELAVGAHAAVVFVEYDRAPEAQYPVAIEQAYVAWSWDSYLPHWEKRAEITASPLRASLDELAGLPDAFVVVDENDVLRDEGEAYARKLTAAGVPTTCVRYSGTLHDFMMLNPLRGTAATTHAVEQAIHVLRGALARH